MKKNKRYSSRAIIIAPVKLAAKQRKLIALTTPPQFIKERKGKGGKTFRYVEGGYMVARLNQIFSPIGWDFSIIDERVETKEVVVRGKLTVKDFRTGYSVSKTQYGTKERHAGGVLLGDTLKAAATDCLKKCSSLFGIALDVYWPELDREKENGVKSKHTEKTVSKTTMNRKELYDFTVKKIKEEENDQILYQMSLKIREASKELYSQVAKDSLIEQIRKKLGVKENEL